MIRGATEIFFSFCSEGFVEAHKISIFLIFQHRNMNRNENEKIRNCRREKKASDGIINIRKKQFLYFFASSSISQIRGI